LLGIGLGHSWHPSRPPGRASQIRCHLLVHQPQTSLNGVATRGFWIGEIRASDGVARKLRTKHNLSVEEVRAACVPNQYDRAGWEVDEVHGERLLVETHDAVGWIRVILQPIDVEDGIWQLRTAWRRM
ncbi:hypothetical protein, partial [Gordonia alkanivorans]